MTLSVQALNAYLETRVKQQRGTLFDYAPNNKIGGFGDYFFPTPA